MFNNISYQASSVVIGPESFSVATLEEGFSSAEDLLVGSDSESSILGYNDWMLYCFKVKKSFTTLTQQ